MVALNNDHRFAVYPYWIRRSFFSERTRLHRVPPQLRWWQDRKGRPTDGKVIMPAANVAPLGLAEEAALLDESHVLPKVACGSGEISEETLRFNGLSSRIGIKDALRAEELSRIRPLPGGRETQLILIGLIKVNFREFLFSDVGE